MSFNFSVVWKFILDYSLHEYTIELFIIYANCLIFVIELSHLISEKMNRPWMGGVGSTSTKCGWKNLSPQKGSLVKGQRKKKPPNPHHKPNLFLPSIPLFPYFANVESSYIH